ncbi:hypothetical protein AB0P05_44660 [Streptomyces flaveolus]|uniref:hypothetical protein n=1 Tax=Streptomyces flaveolus TaxID=67297 RepID=UPI00344ACB9A
MAAGPLHLFLPPRITGSKAFDVRDEIVDLVMFFLDPDREFLAVRDRGSYGGPQHRLFAKA